MNNFWGNKLTLPKNFIFGYGSIINDESRCNYNIPNNNLGNINNSINNQKNNEIFNAIPARLSADLGYRRIWNFRCLTSKFTALGLEKVPKEKACTINGVLYPILNDNLEYFDEREEGYDRIKIPNHLIESCCWINIPNYECNIYIYVPKKENSHLPDHKYPYLQSYLDMCILGCLKYGTQYAKEFLETTFCWNKFWLDDRILSRRPWVYQSNYKIIDKLLKENQEVSGYYKNKKIETIMWNNSLS